jgi:uncharacterized protein (DUF1330 family)
MVAFAIGSLQVRDPSWIEDYRAGTGPLVEKHGGKYLVRGDNMVRFEGDGGLPTVMVMIEFPSMEAAQAWHDDPDYQPLIKLRQSGSDLDMVLVEGL